MNSSKVKTALKRNNRREPVYNYLVRKLRNRCVKYVEKVIDGYQLENKWLQDFVALEMAPELRPLHETIHKLAFRNLARFPNLINPQNYNDRIHWLMLFDQDERIVACSDKIRVRDYIRENVGAKYLTRLIGTYDSVADIDPDKLPQSFAIKTNHDCGSVCLVSNSREILCRYAQKITLIERAENSCTCERPRYEGVLVGKGKYCAFLDVDDLWHPEKISRQIDFLKNHPDIPLCHTHAEIINEEEAPQGIRHEGNMPGLKQMSPSLLEHCYITISSVVVRRNVWIEAMKLDDLNEFGLDWDFFLQINRKYDLGFIPEPLTSYRKSEGAVSKRMWKRRPRNVYSMERHYRQKLWEGMLSHVDAKKNLVRAYLENAEYYLYSPWPWRAIFFLMHGLRYKPYNMRFYVLLMKAFVKEGQRRYR